MATPVATPVATPAEKPADTIYGAGEKKPVKFGDADRAAEDMKKLDSLTKQLLASGAAKPVDKPTDKPTDKPSTSTPSAGGPASWKQIYDMNKDVIGDNPNLIKPGQQLKMPDGSTYTVKPGDNLSKIARGASGEPKKGGGAMPSAGGQPPYTPAKPELGTIKGATQAIPTGPTVPGNPSGVGKNQELSPEERKNAEEALKDPSVSLRDRQWLASRLNVKLPTQEDFNESGEDYNLTPMEAKAALIHGSEQDIEMLGGREKLEQIASSLRESASIKNSLIESFGYTVNEIGDTPAGLDAVEKVGQRAVRAIGDAGTGYSGSELANPEKTFAARHRANAIQNRERIRANDKGRAAYMQRLQQANPSVAGQGAFSNMADQLTKAPGPSSASYVADLAGVSAGEKAAGTAVAKAATSGAWDLLKKRIPFLATAYGAYDTVNRAKKGDYTGAGIAAASAAANLVPGVGTAASLGLDAMNIARDYQRGEFDESLSESIGNLRDRLKDIENRETLNESTAADIWKAAQNLGAGFRQPKAFTTDAGKSAIKAGTPGKTAFTAGQSLRKNNVVPALAVGTGAGLMFTGDKDKKTPAAQVAQGDTDSNKGNKGQGGMPSTGATSADQQSIIDQMNEIIARYNGDGADDEILSYIVPAQNAIAKVTGQGGQTEFTPAVKESSDELARWLKIAHG